MSSDEEDVAWEKGEFINSLSSTPAILKQGDDTETPFDGPTRRGSCISTEQELIIRSYLDDGLSAEEISEEYAIHPSMVKAVVSNTRLKRKAERLKNEIKEKIFEEKVPILEAIGDKGLIALYEWLDAFTASGEHKKLTTRGAMELVGIIKELHTMFRLELGKSTANIGLKGAIEHTSKTMEEILQALKAPPEQGGDPFINYSNTPQLDAPPERITIELPALEPVNAKPN